MSLIVQPNDIFEIAGATPLTGKVVRTGSTAAAANINISITDPNSELVSDATISVTIPANSASATFQLPLANVDATPDGTTSPVTLTATDAAGVLPSTTAKVEVVDPAVSVRLPPKVLETSTSTFTGYVSVNTPASLNTSGLTVSLASSDTGELNLPATVNIPAGKSSASFTFTPISDDGTTLNGTTSVTVTPTLTGYFAKAATVQVVDPEVSVHLSSETLVEATGNGGIGYVSVNTGPVSTNTTVSLVGSDAGAELNLPATVMIPAGLSCAVFSYSPVVDTTADAPVSVTVTPTLTGYFSHTATVQVVDPTLSVKIDPGTISEVAGAKPSSAYGVVTLNTPVPAADAKGLTINLTETVAGAASTEVTIPATVTIPAGHCSATFKITTVPDTTADGPVTVKVTASDLSGFAASGSGNVTVVDQSLILRVTVFPHTVSESGGITSALGVVKLNAPVPSSFTNGLTIKLTETVGGTASTELTIPVSVTIPAGQSLATFTVASVPDTTADGPVTVTITATDPTGTAASGSTTVNVVDSLPNPLKGGKNLLASAADAVFALWGQK